MKTSLLMAVFGLSICGVGAPKMPRMPSLKEGVWLIRSQTIQHPSEEKAEGGGTVCQKADWNNGPMKVKAPRGKCKYAIESGAAKQKYQILCTASEVVIKITETREVIDENSERTVVDISYDPPANGSTGKTLISEGTFVSACPAGVKPGSEMPDGTFAEKAGK
jgi:hypothetical protein